MSIRLLSAASLVALVAACSDQPHTQTRTAVTAVEQAQHAYLIGDYGAAEQGYRAALSAEPNNAAALLGLAETLEQAGRTREALDYYRRAQAARSGDIRVWTHITERNLYRPQDGVTETAYRRMGAIQHGAVASVPVADVMDDFQAPAQLAIPAPQMSVPAQPITTPAPAPSYVVESYESAIAPQPTAYEVDSGYDVYTPDPVVVGSPMVYSDPAPVAYQAAPSYQVIETSPGYAPVETYPAAVETYPAPVETYPAVQTYPVPVETYAPPAGTYPATIQTYPAPVETYPVPVEPAPAYFAPEAVYPPPPKPPVYSTPTPAPVSYQGSGAAPAAYEYDADALTRGVPQTSDALFITPMPKQAPARSQPSGYTIIDGVIEYVGEGQSTPASAGGVEPAVGSTTYETMPVQYGEPVDVVPSAVPRYTPESYSAPRGVDVKGGYEYGN